MAPVPKEMTVNRWVSKVHSGRPHVESALVVCHPTAPVSVRGLRPLPQPNFVLCQCQCPVPSQPLPHKKIQALVSKLVVFCHPPIFIASVVKILEFWKLQPWAKWFPLVSVIVLCDEMHLWCKACQGSTSNALYSKDIPLIAQQQAPYLTITCTPMTSEDQHHHSDQSLGILSTLDCTATINYQDHTPCVLVPYTEA